MIYQLWETRSGNLIDDYASKSEALEAIRHLLDDLGENFVEGCSLSVERQPGSIDLVAEGRELLDLAVATART